MFSRFRELPIELQFKIWDLAVSDVGPVGRIIKVELHYLMLSTIHGCTTDTGQFCGQHGICQIYDTGNGSPSGSAFCISNGYFAQSEANPLWEGPMTDQQLLNLSLACKDSLSAFHKRYPEKMRIFSGKWRPGTKSRVLRCNPAQDILVVAKINEKRCYHVQLGVTGILSMQQQRDILAELSGQFPQNSQEFESFRSILIAFKSFCVVQKDGKSGDDILLTSGCSILYFMQSLETVSIWPDSILFPDVWTDDVLLIEDSKQLPDRGTTSYFFSEASKAVSKYAQISEVQRIHSAPDDHHWTVCPPKLGRIGCYINPTWLNDKTT